VAVVAAAAVIAVAATGGDDDNPTAAGGSSTPVLSSASVPPSPPTSVPTSSAPSTAPSSTAPPVLPPDKALDGRYRVRQVVTSASGVLSSLADSQVGAVAFRSWRVRASCAGSTCAAQVAITGGAIPRVVLHRKGQGWIGVARFTGNCYDANGGVIATRPQTVTYRVAAPLGPDAPKRFTGSITEVGPATSQCTALRIVKRIVVTRAP
jgi:hypothetical protein